MIAVNVTSIAVMIIAFLASCTHTATFSEPAEKSKNIAPSTNRNLENSIIEKELANARTSQAVCSVGAVLRGIFLALGAINKIDDQSNNSSLISNGFTLSATGLICAKYSGFIADWAAACLNGAGVKIES
jgi:hypothetical protein